MTRAKPESFYQLTMEIEREYSNCFSRNLWRNKRTITLFLIKNYRVYSNNQCRWYTWGYSLSETVKLILQIIIFFLSLRFFRPYFLAILVFSRIAFWIRAFNSYSDTSLGPPYWISCYHRSADAIYHLIDSECSNQSDCSIFDR